MNLIFPFTDAGIAGYRQWSNETADRIERTKDQLEALHSAQGGSLIESMARHTPEALLEAHDNLLEAVREANMTPTERGFYEAQALSFALADLETHLYAAECMRVMGPAINRLPA